MHTTKKYIIGGILVVALALYAAWNAITGKPAAAPGGLTNSQNEPSSSQDLYKDGTYKGSVADAYYGPMQVAAVVQKGKLTDVQFLQFPNDQGESRAVSMRSNPVLRQEALTAQGANVDIVSGATQSSQAFSQSLASALAQAK